VIDPPVDAEGEGVQSPGRGEENERKERNCRERDLMGYAEECYGGPPGKRPAEDLEGPRRFLGRCHRVFILSH